MAGEYQESMTIQLICGDCLEVMKTIPEGSVDAVVTDLPYGTTACSWDTIIPFEPMWEQVKRLLKPRGVFVTTASQPFTSKLVMSNLEWFKYEWIWEKSSSGGFINAKNAPMQYHENVLVFCNGITIYNPIMRDYSSITKSTFRKNSVVKKFYGSQNNIHKIEIVEHELDFQRGSFPKAEIYFNSVNVANDGRLHPSEKPIALYEYLIRTYTNKGDTVLDICMGSGTTLVACANTGRNGIGIEIDPGYFKIAEKRIHDAQQHVPLPMAMETA
jgi:site-specific DNA-methyltransferase (adenine-specific)